MGCDPQMQRVVARLGKPFTSIAIPTGLPRFRAKSQCWYNAQRAVINDPRLRYV